VTGADRISLENFDPREGIDAIRDWLHAPHVVRWWGDAEGVIEEVLRPDPCGGDALIRIGDAGVGYIRWSTPGRDELHAAGLGEIPEGTVDVDIAIGEPGNRGRGIAPRALEILTCRLLGEGNAPGLMICPSTRNTRAIRAFEKAGFRRVRTFEDAEYGTSWLMTMDRTAR